MRFLDKYAKLYYIYYRGTELISSKRYDNKNHYYRLDSHGNVTDLVNYLGESQKSYTYTPYGEEKLLNLTPSGEQTILYYWQKETDGIHNPFRYCGEYYDEESGLIYLRNRYYDPTSGRFITEDPARDGMNWYVYANNNPLNHIDPLGLYYIVSDVTHCPCMDPRCNNFSKPTGTYTAHPENWMTIAAKTATGFLPLGSLINMFGENSLGVVAGSSSITPNDVGIDTTLSVGEYILETSSKKGVTATVKKIETLLGNVIPIWLGFATEIVVRVLCSSMLNLETGLYEGFIAIFVPIGSFFAWRLLIVWIESKFDKKKLQKLDSIKTTKGKIFTVILSLITTIVTAMLASGYADEWYANGHGRSMRVSVEMKGCVLFFVTFFGIWAIVITSVENALWKRKVKKRTNKKK